MLEKVLKTIENNTMLKAGDKVICATSGGADSMALLYALYELSEKLGINLFAAHLNHSIRGEEADKDEEFVREFCEKHKIELFVKKVDVTRVAKEKGIGEEECGREERYLFFDTLSKNLGGALIATGHHMEDRAETVLFNLFRGSGVLKGIPVKRGNIIRPLYNVSKKEAEEFLRKNGISWRVDRTNLDTKYTRNKIRHMLKDTVEPYFPKAVEKIAEIEERSKSDDEYLTFLAKETGAFCEGKLYCEKLIPLHESIRRRVVKEALLWWGIGDVDAKSIEIVTSLAKGESGRMAVLKNGITLINNYSVISQTKKEKNEIENKNFCVGETLEIRHSGGIWKLKTVDKKPQMRDNKMMIILDSDKVGECLSVRGRCDGDFMHPMGMNGKKKVKEIFIDLKIPREERNGISLLAKDNEVLFIPNIRKTGRYLPDNDTKKFFIAEYKAFETKEKRDGREKI